MSTYLRSKVTTLAFVAAFLFSTVPPVPAPEVEPTAAPQATNQTPPGGVPAPELPPKLNKAERKAPSKPVRWLTQSQMNNAIEVVQAARRLGLGERAQVVGIMTAMQESRITVLASTAIPSSRKYPHDGVGSDHDSVGIFQQRPSMGWGSVRECMDPQYSATAFFRALKRVDGWESMGLTYAAQAVQKSAYPEAYAKHEGDARAVVNAANRYIDS